MSEKESPLTDTPDEGVASENQSPADADELNRQHLKEAYERAREDLKATAERLKTEIENIDAEEISQSTTLWIKENPALALALVVGAGIVVGKAVTSFSKPAPPPSLRDRVKAGTENISLSARNAANIAADRLSEKAKVQGAHLASRLQDVKGNLNENAASFGNILNDQAHQLSEVASVKTNHIISSFSDAAERAADSLHVAAKDLSKSAKKYKKGSPKGIVPFAQASKTLISAYVLKQLSDWIRKRG